MEEVPGWQKELNNIPISWISLTHCALRKKKSREKRKKGVLMNILEMRKKEGKECDREDANKKKKRLFNFLTDIDPALVGFTWCVCSDS